MLAKIEQLLQKIEGLQAANAEELEALRIKYLSKKGAINELMADFRNVPAEQKKEVGSHLFRTGKSYGTFATSYPHHLSGTCIPQ